MPPQDLGVPVITDKDEKDGMISTFQCAVKSYSYFYHICFLECCKHVGIRPSGLKIRNTPFVQFEDGVIQVEWDKTIDRCENELVETLLLGLSDKMLSFEEKFWTFLLETEERTDVDKFTEWWVKLMQFLEKDEHQLKKKKLKKLRKLLQEDEEKLSEALKRFDEHCDCFEFKKDWNSMDVRYLRIWKVWLTWFL